MSGHNKWAQIKHQKGATDQKRGKLFSKLLRAITAAAKTENDPKFNPRLRSAVLKAKENNVPQENIERAINKALGEGEALDELLFEAYDGSGVAVLIEAVSDNRNRTVAEIKKILSDHKAKWAESGSVTWAFEKGIEGWKAKFFHETSADQKKALEELILALEDHDDVVSVRTNAKQ